MQGTKRRYQPEQSLAMALPFSFVVPVWIKVDLAEKLDDFCLLVPADIFFESRRHSSLLGFVTADNSGLFDQAVVNGEIRWHSGMCSRSPRKPTRGWRPRPIDLAQKN